MEGRKQEEKELEVEPIMGFLTKMRILPG